MLEPVPRERSQGRAVFGMALRCVPYVRPTHWANEQMARDLPGVDVCLLLYVCIQEDPECRPESVYASMGQASSSGCQVW